ncbi:hypothetical protein [Helicobacter sp. 23-1045]
MRENIKKTQNLMRKISKSQNLHCSPSLRDFAKQNRGNPRFCERRI